MSKTGARVVVMKDGPYIVSGGVPLSKQTIVTDKEGSPEAWEEGAAFKSPKTYLLCRCGHSQSKPFCDNSHIKVRFDGSETASREPYLKQAQSIEGPTAVLTDAEHLCADARFCNAHGGVWNEVKQSDVPDVRETFIRQVGKCPSGRLVAWDKETKMPIEPVLPVSIGLIEDPARECSGPIWVRGGIPVVSADGFEYEVRNRATLCRCGQSKNKPFCDGTHAQINFKDT